MATYNKKLILRALLNDLVIGLCFWSLIVFPSSLFFLQYFVISHPLAVILLKSSILASFSFLLFTLPLSLRKIYIALYLTRNGIEVVGKIKSVDPFLYGSKVNFEFEYDGHSYNKEKFFPIVLFSLPEKGKMTLLIDPGNPSKFIVLELKKRSIFSNLKYMD